MIFAALDLLDHGPVAAIARDRGAQIQPTAMQVRCQRAVIVGRAAKGTDDLLQPFDDLPPFPGEVTEQIRIDFGVGIFDRTFEAVCAVDRSGDQGIQNLDVMVGRHWPLLECTSSTVPLMKSSI